MDHNVASFLSRHRETVACVLAVAFSLAMLAVVIRVAVKVIAEAVHEHNRGPIDGRQSHWNDSYYEEE